MVLPPFSHGSNEPHGMIQLKSSRKVDILTQILSAMKFNALGAWRKKET